MYHNPRTNLIDYPYMNVNTQGYSSNYMARTSLGLEQEALEALLAGMKREASAIDIYSQLFYIAPNRNHKNTIQHELVNKNARLKQFTDLYIALTGRQPVYQIDKPSIKNYHDGLQKAYEAEVEGSQEYWKSYFLTQNPQVRSVLSWAFLEEEEIATRFEGFQEGGGQKLKDYGPNPFVINIDEATKQNDTFRTALWTGDHLQVTLMSIDVGEDIGLEIHPDLDQFLRVEQGQGVVQMGDSKEQLDFQENVYDDYAIVIPAGKWHNLTNTGNVPLKLYSIYAPPQHPFGTVHETKAEAMEAEENHH
ncbi:cupin domain-containing protein [Mesobacillus maritimus]|uniref:cupin domain-containing protein n=1 Tax=Mesobacillus maritimus TaxID=1643336 RepID=UPI00384AF1C9